MEDFDEYLKKESFGLNIHDKVCLSEKIVPEKFHRILDSLSRQKRSIDQATHLVGHMGGMLNWKIELDPAGQKFQDVVSKIASKKWSELPLEWSKTTQVESVIGELPQVKIQRLKPSSIHQLDQVDPGTGSTVDFRLEAVFVASLEGGNKMILSKYLEGENPEQLSLNDYQYRICFQVENDDYLSDFYQFVVSMSGGAFNLNELLVKFRLYSEIFSLYSKNDFMAGLINKKISHMDQNFQQKLETTVEPSRIERMPVFGKVHTVIMEPVVDISREDLPLLLCDNSDYCVTDKADGTREMLFVDSDGSLYFTGFGSLQQLNIQTKQYRSCLFDGELVSTKIGRMYLIFDCLFWNGESLLDLPLLETNHSSHYRYRKEDLEQLCDILNSLSSKDLIFSFKNYYHHRKELEQKKLCQEVYQKDYPYSLDGLIFTNYTYSVVEMIQNRSQACFRWKPLEYLSIDALVRIKKDPDFPLDSQYYRESDRLFVRADIYGRNDFNYHQLDLLDTVDLELEKGKIPRTKAGEPIFDQTVIEFIRDDGKESGWIPIRTREGKTVLELYDRTGKVTSIKKMTHAPISEKELYSYQCPRGDDEPLAKDPPKTDLTYFFENPYKNFVRKHYLIHVVNFNNLVKFNVIQRYIFYRGRDNLPNFLDLACGRGNDLYIWHNNVSFYLGIDIDEENIRTCKKVLCPTFKLGNKYRFMEQDLAKPNLLTSIQSSFKRPSTKFNIISIQFALHYLTSSTEEIGNLIKVCSQLIHRNGYLIFTGLDGAIIHELLSRQKQLSFHSDQGDLLWKVERGYPIDQPFLRAGQLIYFTMQSLMGFKPSKEFLINFDYISDRLKRNGFTLVESKQFSEILEDGKQFQSYADNLAANCPFKRYTTMDYSSLRKTMLGNNYLHSLTKLYRYCVFRY
jgi:hypothetical protein